MRQRVVRPQAGGQVLDRVRGGRGGGGEGLWKEGGGRRHAAARRIAGTRGLFAAGPLSSPPLSPSYLVPAKRGDRGGRVSDVARKLDQGQGARGHGQGESGEGGGRGVAHSGRREGRRAVWRGWRCLALSPTLSRRCMLWQARLTSFLAGLGIGSAFTLVTLRSDLQQATRLLADQVRGGGGGRARPPSRVSCHGWRLSRGGRGGAARGGAGRAPRFRSIEARPRPAPPGRPPALVALHAIGARCAAPPIAAQRAARCPRPPRPRDAARKRGRRRAARGAPRAARANTRAVGTTVAAPPGGSGAAFAPAAGGAERREAIARARKRLPARRPPPSRPRHPLSPLRSPPPTRPRTRA